MAVDDWIASADQALRTLTGGAHAGRMAPLADEGELTPQERRLSGALMRVDHVGEVCAQALYQAQALTARSPQLRAHMQRAAADEVDHLAWTANGGLLVGDRSTGTLDRWGDVPDQTTRIGTIPAMATNRFGGLVVDMP